MRARRLRPERRKQRGMTLLEIIVSLAILSMISLLIYGAFDSMSRGKKGEALRVERAHQGRAAVLRIARELQSAYLSLHTPTVPALQTRLTAFIASSSTNYDRVDFASFAHRRTEASSHESDQAEIGYFVVRDPDHDGKMDLVRREQVPMDMDPKRGGVVNVVAENVESFSLRFLDPMSGLWVETWDTQQAATGQYNRLPLEIEIKLTLAEVPGAAAATYTTKTTLPMQQPLSFAIPR